MEQYLWALLLRGTEKKCKQHFEEGGECHQVETGRKMGGPEHSKDSTRNLVDGGRALTSVF